MKLILTVIILLSGLVLYSQPVLEHSYSESASLTNLEIIGEIYFSMDVVNKQCLIYDMDHNFLKSIALPTPEGYYLENIQFLSEHLFNDDDLLELVYIYSKYIPTDLSYYFIYESKLINENGATISTFPGAGYTNVVETADQDKKFLVYQYDYSVIPFRTYTHVYGLPGETEPSAASDLTAFSPGDAFPNPASKMLTIPVLLPHGEHSGSLEIFDMNGRKITSYPVTADADKLVLSTSQLSVGTYLYHIKTGNQHSEARKFVIR